jgi:hypothetical protein
MVVSAGRLTVPLSGSVRPTTISSRVVLPAPLPPMSATRRPGDNWSVTSVNSGEVPYDLATRERVSMAAQGTRPPQ